MNGDLAEQGALANVKGSARRWLGALIVFVTLFLLWEFVVKLLGIKEYLLPPPSKIWTEFLKRQSTVMNSAWITTVEIIGGYLLAVAVSIPLAMAIAYSRFVENTIYPVIVFLQIIPKIAIAPLFIIWLGFGLLPKLLIVFLLCFFPIVVSSVAGFKSVDPDVVELMMDGNDVPLIAQGRPVRLQFEGWPALQFSGWPSIAVGTFGGRVLLVDSTDNGHGKFRVLVEKDPREDAWPGQNYLRQGVRANGWILLNQVQTS